MTLEGQGVRLDLVRRLEYLSAGVPSGPGLYAPSVGKLILCGRSRSSKSNRPVESY